ncbi:hypothetical protein SLH49_06860 [Cognatiyoonia sp. IB215446]|uniref:hypothetical protein n=1 Tax=Cognatiyoonia sp. IB215446 TaxID=3097355 RepID=UPI002A13C489|nr:hypothetical protein [Cognatiyoonia sp. IB215446]MDX8347702.1 hypothetical protein [Cognatiyoonia sp. IB215446]
MRAVLVCLTCLISLAACSDSDGSEDSSTVDASAATSTLTGTPEDDFAFDEVDNTITIAGGDALSPTNNTSISVPASFVVYSDDMDGILAIRGVTASGDGEVAIYSDGSAALTGAFGARLEDTAVPTAGRVVYDGDYVGILRDTGTGDITHTVTGVAQLVAYFGDGNISGNISIRRASELDGTATRPLNTLLLDSTALADGAFAGTTGGGGFTTSAAGAEDGAYSGLIVGSNGDELVGNININHTTNGIVTGQEVGGIIAAE